MVRIDLKVICYHLNVIQYTHRKSRRDEPSMQKRIRYLRRMLKSWVVMISFERPYIQSGFLTQYWLKGQIANGRCTSISRTQTNLAQTPVGRFYNRACNIELYGCLLRLHSVLMIYADDENTSFIIDMGLYCYKMPFELNNTGLPIKGW